MEGLLAPNASASANAASASSGDSLRYCVLAIDRLVNGTYCPVRVGSRVMDAAVPIPLSHTSSSSTSSVPSCSVPSSGGSAGAAAASGTDAAHGDSVQTDWKALSIQHYPGEDVWLSIRSAVQGLPQSTPSLSHFMSRTPTPIQSQH